MAIAQMLELHGSVTLWGHLFSFDNFPKNLCSLLSENRVTSSFCNSSLLKIKHICLVPSFPSPKEIGQYPVLLAIIPQKDFSP